MRIVAGTHKNRTIVTPKGLETRPTSERLREALFNICQTYIADARFLDLFAGSGAMGMEALSRGASQATFIDDSKESIKCIKMNVEKLQMQDHARILIGDVFLMMEKLVKLGNQFDIIYADPPYSKGEPNSYSQRVLDFIENSPLLAPSGVLFLEESSAFPPQGEGLSTLVLKSSRQLGRSVLQQYQKQ